VTPPSNEYYAKRIFKNKLSKHQCKIINEYKNAQKHEKQTATPWEKQ